MEVKFYETVPDEWFRFAVIFAIAGGKWVFCRHRARSTLEAPGGHREQGESIDEAAARELREETGALQFRIQPVCAYSVTGQTPANRTGEETFGMLYWAEIESFAPELHSEIAEIFLMDELPENWTYPEIQPKLLAELRRRGLTPANSNPSESTGIGPKSTAETF